VLWNAGPLPVQDSQPKHPQAAPLLSRPTKPLSRQRKILGPALSLGKHSPQESLTKFITLFCRLAVPTNGLCIVPQDTLSLLAFAAHLELGECITLIGRFADPARGFGDIPRPSFAFVI